MMQPTARKPIPSLRLLCERQNRMFAATEKQPLKKPLSARQGVRCTLLPHTWLQRTDSATRMACTAPAICSQMQSGAAALKLVQPLSLALAACVLQVKKSVAEGEQAGCLQTEAGQQLLFHPCLAAMRSYGAFCCEEIQNWKKIRDYTYTDADLAQPVFYFLAQGCA